MHITYGVNGCKKYMLEFYAAETTTQLFKQHFFFNGNLIFLGYISVEVILHYHFRGISGGILTV